MKMMTYGIRTPSIELARLGAMRASQERVHAAIVEAFMIPSEIILGLGSSLDNLSTAADQAAFSMERFNESIGRMQTLIVGTRKRRQLDEHYSLLKMVGL